MKKSGVSSVAEFLESLPAERSAALQAVRKVINKNLPRGYQETFAWGMITWSVPLAVCIRFKRLDDLALDVIADVTRSVPVKAFVEIAKKAHAKRK